MQNVFAFSGSPSGIQLKKIQGDEVGGDFLRRAGDGHQDDACAQAGGDEYIFFLFNKGLG